MRVRQWVWALGVIVMLGGGVADAFGQAGAGALTGVVHDQSGAAVPGATVTATQAGTNRPRLVISNRAGVYTAAGLAPGVYRVVVTLAGFRPLVREGVQVATGQTLRLDLDLVLGDVTETVTVSADVPVLQHETAALGQIIDHEKIVELPLNGRSFVSLTALAPGVAMPAGQPFPRINGGRPRTNEYLFDGISVLQPEPGQVAYFPIIDAIQDFKIESNSPPAEFGRFNGGVVNLTTKAGSNHFAGDGFEFFRNEALNARNFFAPADSIEPEFRRHQFGGVVGGPIRWNQTFFFADYQGQRQKIGRTAISTVPTVLQRQGIFTEAIAGRVPIIYDPSTTTPAANGGFSRTPFSANTIPIDRIDPVALVFLQRYPLPTAVGTANNYTRTGNEIDDQNQFDVRVDHRFPADGDQLFGRLSFFQDTFVPVAPLPDGSGVTTGTLGPQDTHAWAFASNYQRMFSDHLFNEVRIGDTGRWVGRTAVELPTFLIAGYQQLGSPPNTASDFSTGVTEVVDALTWLKGRHTIKTGLDFRWERLNVVQPPSPNGLFQFSSLFTDLPGSANTGSPLASFLLGQVQTFSIDVQPQQIRNRARIQEYFVQDDWKISDRLTLNAGVRYTLNFPSTEEHNQAAVFNLKTQQLEYLGRDGHPRSARELHKLDFGPRVGVTRRLTEKMVLSSGYGLVWIEQAGITTPFTTPVFPFLQTVSQRTLDNLTPAFVLANGPTVAPLPLTPDAGLGQGVFAVDRGLGSGYVQQWNISLQRELTTNSAVQVAYAGSKITRVGIPDSNLNQLSASQLALGSALLQRVPNPYFGIIPRSSSLGDPTIPLAQLLKPYPAYTTVSLYRNNVGTSIYHGLEARLEQRLSHGLSYLVGYTRSKLVDDASSVFDASILTGPVADYPVADSFNRKLDRDYSTGDIPHVFVASIGLTRHDWTVTGILRLQSGAPVAVTQNTNFNAFAGFGIQRPNLVGDPTLPGDRRIVSQWFDTSAFSVAPQFTIGTSSRNPVRGPSYRDLDVALIRRVPFAAGKAFELRVEAFNLTNTPPLGAPNAVLGAGNFGTITSAGDPRVVQLALKLLF